MSKALFITGTGTDIGKTYVSALIVKKLKDIGKSSAYFKAAVSGNIRDENKKLIPADAKYVKDISKIEQDTDTMCPFVYERAVSPHLASRLEGNPVVLKTVQTYYDNLKKQYDYITMEGSGGILCPICFDEEEIWLEDIIKLFDMPAVIVADAGLGTINSVVLTVEYMKQKNIKINGIIFNNYIKGDIMHEDNIKMVEQRTGIKVIACVKKGDKELDINADTLLDLYE